MTRLCGAPDDIFQLLHVLNKIVLLHRELDLEGVIELLGKEFGRAEQTDLAMVDHTDTVSKDARLLHVLRGNDNDAVLLSARYGLPDEALRLRVHALCRVVEKDKSRVADHTEGKGEHLLLLAIELNAGDITNIKKLVVRECAINGLLVNGQAKEVVE